MVHKPESFTRESLKHANRPFHWKWSLEANWEHRITIEQLVSYFIGMAADFWRTFVETLDAVAMEQWMWVPDQCPLNIKQSQTWAIKSRHFQLYPASPLSRGVVRGLGLDLAVSHHLLCGTHNDFSHHNHCSIYSDSVLQCWSVAAHCVWVVPPRGVMNRNVMLPALHGVIKLFSLPLFANSHTCTLVHSDLPVALWEQQGLAE